MGSAARVAALAHEHYDKAAAILAAKPKGRIATPRLMGAVYAEILQGHGGGRASCRRAIACRCRGASCCRWCCAQVSDESRFGMSGRTAPRLCDRRGHCRPGRRHALAAQGVAVTLYEAAGQAGGRCRSYYDPALDQVIDNGNHLVLSGNGAVASLSGAHRRARRA